MRNLIFRRRLPLLVGLIVVTLLPACCTQGPDSISEKKILKVINTELKEFGSKELLCQVDTGRYEEPDTLERIRLRKLSIAGLISYKVDRYAWWEKHTITKTKVERADPFTRYFVNSIFDSNWDGRSYRKVKAYETHFVTKYIVEVGLTAKGKKLLTEPEVRVTDVEYDDKLEDPAQYPWNQQDLAEHWPVIENPFVEKENKSDGNKAAKANVKKPEKPVVQEKIPRIDSLQYIRYICFKDIEERRSPVFFKAFNLKAVKASDIQLYEDSGFRKSKAEVELVLKNVTDAGRIHFGVREGEGRTLTALMDYYVDKGWKPDHKVLEGKIYEFFVPAREDGMALDE